MKNLTWQNPEQLFVAQVLINKVKSKCCGIKDTVFYHTFFDLKLVYEVGPESFLPPPTVKSALLNIKRKHLFFDFKFKAKYLAFISCLLEKPDLSVKTALKSIFRKSQVRSISEKFGLNLNAQIVCLSPSQWLNCFLEMLEVVPEKFHPS